MAAQHRAVPALFPRYDTLLQSGLDAGAASLRGELDLFQDSAILAQSWFVHDRIRSTLEAVGGRMDQVVRLVQYVKDLDWFPRDSRVRHPFCPGEPPASTLLQVGGMLPASDILAEDEATACVPLVSKD